MEGGGGGASAFSLGMHHGWKGGRSREIRAASRKEGGGALSFMRKKTAQSLTCGTHLSARKGVGRRWQRAKGIDGAGGRLCGAAGPARLDGPRIERAELQGGQGRAGHKEERAKEGERVRFSFSFISEFFKTIFQMGFESFFRFGQNHTSTKIKCTSHACHNMYISL